MKTTAIKIAFVAIIITVSSIFSVSAQGSDNFFFDRKEVNGQLISKTKYEMSYSGIFEKTYLYEYSYNDLGYVTKETVSKWNSKKSEWEPDRMIQHLYNMTDNTVTLEYAKWNKKEKKYDDAAEKMVYKVDESGNIISWSITKGKDQNEDIYFAYNADALFQQNLAYTFHNK